MENKTKTIRQPGSFRDPSGFLFYYENNLYRQINPIYKDNYDLLMNSGLYQKLIDKKLLVEHGEVDLRVDQGLPAYKIIKPQIVPFISYPYEWAFSALKDAALATLKIQSLALEHGMSLKDASAYNVQFVNTRPIMIDTLSFEKYEEGQPWVAYKQFCQHFLAPLALMATRDARLNQFFRVFIDGVPLDLASRLLGAKTHLDFSLLTHIHLHAKSQARYADKNVNKKAAHLSKHSFLALLDNLEKAIRKLKWDLPKTEWGDYYKDTNYNQDAFNEKHNLIKSFIDKVKPKTVWDLGANTGKFSRLASATGAHTISFDIDIAAVEKNYHGCREKREKNLLPLFLDLSNPSPSLGWHSRERSSLVERGPADLVMALALIHHLAISNNLPFKHITRFMADICHYLIIEFVPKSDSKVKRLLTTREDIFPDYDQAHFERSFRKYFDILETKPIKHSKRTLFLMKKR